MPIGVIGVHAGSSGVIPDPPADPVITAIADGGDNASVVVSITGVSTIRLFYQVRYSNVEVVGLTRSGSGDITQTGLAAGVAYDFYCVSDDGTLLSGPSNIVTQLVSVPSEDPTTLDIKLGPKVLSIIDRFGKYVVIGQTPNETYDPDTGSVTAGVLVEYRQKVSPPDDYNNKLVDGDLIKLGDSMVLLPAKDLAFVPKIGDSVTFDSLIWKMITVKPIYSGELVVVYELQLRR